MTDGLVDAKVWEVSITPQVMEPQLVEVILGTVNVFLVIVDLVAQGWRLLMVVSVGYLSLMEDLEEVLQVGTVLQEAQLAEDSAEAVRRTTVMEMVVVVALS